MIVEDHEKKDKYRITVNTCKITFMLTGQKRQIFFLKHYVMYILSLKHAWNVTLVFFLPCSIHLQKLKARCFFSVYNAYANFIKSKIYLLKFLSQITIDAKSVLSNSKSFKY